MFLRLDYEFPPAAQETVFPFRFPDQARHWLAKVNFDAPEDMRLPGVLFNYRQDEDGRKPILGLSKFRFSVPHDKLGLSIIGIGEYGAQFLRYEGERIRNLIEHAIGSPPVERCSEGLMTFGIDRRGCRHHYLVKNLVVTHTQKGFRMLHDAVVVDQDDEQVSSKVLTVLRNALRSHSSLIDIDETALADPESVFGTPWVDWTRGSFPVNVHGSKRITLRAVHFHTPYRFLGPWNLGPLASRGMGRLCYLGKARNE